MYPPTAKWREGYYEGATEDGGRVLFLVPSKTNVIARFQVVLNVLTTSATEDDFASTYGFDAQDVKIFHGPFDTCHVRDFCSHSTVVAANLALIVGLVLK